MMDVDKIKFTSSANRCMDQLKGLVESKNHNIANSCHIFLLAIQNCNERFSGFIKSRGIIIEIDKIEKLVDKMAKVNPDGFISDAVPYRLCESVNELVRKSFKTAHKYNHGYVGVEHMIYSFLDGNDKFCDLMLSDDIDTEHFKISTLAFLAEIDNMPMIDDGYEYEYEDDDDEDEESSFTGSYLAKYAQNLNEIVQDESFPIISGRDSEINLMQEILCRKTKSNCILVGEAGTGKTTIVEGLAQLLSNDNYEGPLEGKVVYSLDVGALVAGTKYRGQFEERFNRFLAELKETPNAILFIDEIHAIIGTGSREGSQDLANMLKPILARGEIMCIGATTSTEYKKYFEKDAALSRRFHAIHVDEPDMEQVMKMALKAAPSYEQHHQISFAPKVIEAAVQMCAVYLPNQRFPDKAFDIIDHSCSKARMNGASKVLVDDVAAVIAEKIKVDVETIKASQNHKFSEFQNNMESVIFGQNDNLCKIYDTLACAKAGFYYPDKPLASFFFVGPTSVGKTFTAKKIAKEFYGNEKSFLQLNMSEYQESASISRLIGASAGYVGFEEGGLLTEFVRKNPNSLILFDEAEKCSPSILNLLLQILDEAKLKDNLNRDVDFSRCIVVLTSNVGSDINTKPSMGFVQDSIDSEQEYKKSVFKYLPPELSARIDDVIVFNDLDSVSLSKIVDSKLQEISNRLKNNKINITFDVKASDLIDLNDKSHARDIKKTIKQKIEMPLAKFMIQNPKSKNLSVKMLDGKAVVC